MFEYFKLINKNMVMELQLHKQDLRSYYKESHICIYSL